MQTRFLDRGPGRIAYSVAGTGPLVVCLPGMGELRSLYRFLTPALAEAGLRVATMDLRGHGDSDDGFDRYDDVAAGQDALALIEELGGPAVVVGTSMGAGAAVWAAAERPDLVAGLVLAGPFVRNPPTNALMALLLKLAFLRPWGPAALKAYLVKAYPGRRPPDFDEHWAHLRAAQRRGDHWRSFVRTSRTDHGPAQARLGQVRAPALVIMGEKDPDWSDPVAEARYVAEALGAGALGAGALGAGALGAGELGAGAPGMQTRGAELLLVPDAGHYVTAEYPEIMTPAVIAFARRIHAIA